MGIGEKPVSLMRPLKRRKNRLVLSLTFVSGMKRTEDRFEDDDANAIKYF